MSPPSCPYALTLLASGQGFATYLIREKDNFGEYPNIYAKVYYENATREAIVIVMSDSGTGLNVPNGHSGISNIANEHAEIARSGSSPARWNIATYLSMTLNPDHKAPYIVLTTHCHYDHICGIQHLLDAKADVTVLSSSHDKAYLTPWRNLQKHSLCGLNGLKAPRYDGHWIDDAQKISYNGTGGERKETSVIVIHTPGHTPDSLSWYDHDTYALNVGDMFYERESDITRSGSNGTWAREPPQPVIFTQDSNVIEWNASMHRLLDFVRYENVKMGTKTTHQPRGYRQNGQGTSIEFNESDAQDDTWALITKTPEHRRVALCAAHVTIAADAESAILDMLAFMLRVQLDQVPKEKVPDIEGKDDCWLWDDSLATSTDEVGNSLYYGVYQYSLRAPWSVIHHQSSNSIAPSTSTPPAKAQSSDFRSMIRQMASPMHISSQLPYLKSNALASVSHSSVMADRPAVSTASIARKG